MKNFKEKEIIEIVGKGMLFYVEDRDNSQNKRPFLIISETGSIKIRNRVQCFRIVPKTFNSEQMIPIIVDGCKSYINPYEVCSFPKEVFHIKYYMGILDDFILDLSIKIFSTIVLGAIEDRDQIMDLLKLYQEEFHEKYPDIQETRSLPRFNTKPLPKHPEPRKNASATKRMSASNVISPIPNSLVIPISLYLKEDQDDPDAEWEVVNHQFPRSVQNWTNDELIKIMNLKEKKGLSFLGEILGIGTLPYLKKKIDVIQLELASRGLN